MYLLIKLTVSGPICRKSVLDDKTKMIQPDRKFYNFLYNFEEYLASRFI